jgi:alkanesulfonate monooxygenase SsuD/methylene tetrahydromethanopterin reductase-like flavin-dependent oxidoreductase (luciferase family)
MRVLTTAPLEDPRDARTLFPRLEAIGYDGAFSFEAKHDPFLPLAAAAEHTHRFQLGTAIAIAFARNPMNLANIGYDLQVLTEGRFILAIRAIWDCWEGRGDLRFEGEFYRHTLMIPAFDPGPNPFGPPPIYCGGFGPRMVEVVGEVADGFIAHPFNSRKSLEERSRAGREIRSPSSVRRSSLRRTGRRSLRESRKS